MDRAALRADVALERRLRVAAVRAPRPKPPGKPLNHQAGHLVCSRRCRRTRRAPSHRRRNRSRRQRVRPKKPSDNQRVRDIIALLKQIAQFGEEIKLAARDYDPCHINRYLQELAACFHRFYTACRIKGEAAAVRDARLKLADDTRIVLRNGLKLIGVEAPEKM